MSAFRGCNFCGGRGCLFCEAEREKAIKRAQEPIFVADRNDPHDMALLNRVIGADALNHAFGPDGDGAAEIEREAAIASFLQFARKNKVAEQAASERAIGNWIDQAPMPNGLNGPVGDEAGQE